MNLLWYVALGSAVGGASRFALSNFIQQRAGVFPVGTLVVNITGSLALGFLLLAFLCYVLSFNPAMAAFIAIGMLLEVAYWVTVLIASAQPPSESG